MTPLGRFYARHLPARAVWAALTLTYAAALILLVLKSHPTTDNLVYIDMETRQ